MDNQRDHLEDFVKSNRQQFDTKEPSTKVWQDIEKQLPRQIKNSGWGIWMWRAASLVFFCTTAYLWTVRPVQPEEITSRSAYSDDFGRVESYYFSVISEKENQLVDYQNRIELLGGYEVDMQKLDAMYEVLKEELKKNPSNEDVKDALTLNLLIRIDLLNEQLRAVEETKPKEEHRGV